MWILALEASTTSAKAMLYNTDTGEFDEKTKAYGRMNVEEVLHDAKTVFDCMAEVGRELSDGKDVDIISLSGTWHSVMLCNKDMSPVTPVYPWSYTGASQMCRELRKDPKYVNEYYQRTGCMVNATYPFFKLLHLKKQGYNLRKYLIVGQGTYNNYRLTGQRITTRCLVSGSGLLNIHSGEYEEKYLQEAQITVAQLPQLCNSNETFPLSAEGAKILGQKEGTPVLITNSDGGLNQIGVGAIQDDVMTFSVGTSGAMRITTKQPVLPETKGTWCYLSPKGWLSGAATAGCCNCIDWFCNQIAGLGLSREELERKVDNIEDTPVFLPFLFGERCPGWDDERTGGFLHVKAHHTVNDLYRAVQQGILFQLFQCYMILTEVAGIPKRIKLSGGILHSDVWTQMCADIFGKELEIDESKQSSLMGAIILARQQIGDLPSVEAYTSKVTKLVKPDLDKTKIYEAKFQEFVKEYKERT